MWTLWLSDQVEEQISGPQESSQNCLTFTINFCHGNKCSQHLTLSFMVYMACQFIPGQGKEEIFLALLWFLIFSILLYSSVDFSVLCIVDSINNGLVFVWNYCRKVLSKLAHLTLKANPCWLMNCLCNVKKDSINICCEYKQ